MNPPFTAEQFFEVFKNYNESVFPMQVVFYLLSFTAIYLVFKPNYKSDKIISIVLSFFWIWMGIVYHIIFFSSVNPLAKIFGILFIIQGILFIVYGVIYKKLTFKFNRDKYSISGLVMILFALFIYPLSGKYLGHIYPFSPTFGLPCPTVIFTFGFLLLNENKSPASILIIPLFWTISGFSAVIYFGIAEDTSLLISGLLAFSMIMYRNRSFSAGEK